MAIGIRDLMANHNIPNKNDNDKIIYIDFDKLIPCENNFYSINEIEELAFNIDLIGIMQPLNVRKVKDGFYEIIGGHRRRAAIEHIIKNFGEEAAEKVKKVPCIERIENSGNEEIDNIRYSLRLIMENAHNRIKNDYDKMLEIQKLKELLERLKKIDDNAIKGRTRDWVAQILNTSSSSVAKLESINNNLSEEFKEEFREKKINTSQAYAMSQKEEEEQAAAYEEYKNKGALPKADEIKEKPEVKIEEAEKSAQEIEEEEKSNLEEDKRENERFSESEGEDSALPSRESNFYNDNKPQGVSEKFKENVAEVFRRFFGYGNGIYFINFAWIGTKQDSMKFDLNIKVEFEYLTANSNEISISFKDKISFLQFRYENLKACGVRAGEDKEKVFYIRLDNSEIEIRKAEG